MTLWRIKNGIPSVADALLVVGGPIGTCTGFIPIIEPLLDYFEPRGLAFVGFAIVLLVMFATGAAAVWAFFRNEKRIRHEVVIPRRVLALTSAPLVLMATVLTSVWADRAEIGFVEHMALCVLSFVPLFGLVVRASLRFPQRAAEVALWFQVGLGALGLLAKFAGLFLKK